MWKDFFWYDIFFYYLFNYELLRQSNFDQHKNHDGCHVVFVDDDVAGHIWSVIIDVCRDIVFDIRHYDYTTSINACHKMLEKTFELYLKQYDHKNTFIVVKEEVC